MAKIPFSIDYKPQIESGEYKVETRDGRPVKIISFELTDTNDCPIAAQFRLCAGTPVVYLFDENGEYRGEGASDYDLFIITPEPKMTKFEKAVKDLCWRVGMGEVVYEDDIIKKTAAELLDLAREQLVEEQYTSDPRKTDLYKLGREEALKDLPRWKKAKRDMRVVGRCVIEWNGDIDLSNFVPKESYYIPVKDLLELPGFKEI